MKLAPILILFLECCASVPRANVAVTGTAHELALVKSRVMAADYRADIKALAALRDELAAWPNDRELAYAARYWKGFASWRMAINGASNGMKSEDLSSNLHNAATDFYVAIRLKEDFTDAYAAASMVNGWLGAFDPASMQERLALSQALFARATALDPQNPRVLWAKASYSLFSPKPDIAKALDVYAQMLAESERRGADAASPLPDWGKPEALMSIAYAHTMPTPPDFAAARSHANAALKLEPEWSYVRDKLIPLIDRAAVR